MDERKGKSTMNPNQQRMPLLEKLHEFAKGRPMSWHVPGHKNGQIFPEAAHRHYEAILPIDLTELSGLDDLHAPSGVIGEAEKLAADYFQAEHTFFLVGGSTAGNLAMILATVSSGEKIIVQRNCHKSVMNGLELSGAKPVFISPKYDEAAARFTHPDFSTLRQALNRHPDAKAVVLTYPDYFGGTYDLEEMIYLAHDKGVPVLVDEAHGVHFALGEPFPKPALQLGADIVVQSAHKMAPAMTMSSYLHMKTVLVSKERVAHYLQILQSSSPSYPLMASLDLARFFLAQLDRQGLSGILESVRQTRKILGAAVKWDLLPSDDPLKITIQLKEGFSAGEAASLFEREGIYPELVSQHQILFIHGLAEYRQFQHLKKAVKSVEERLKNHRNHATIEMAEIFPETIQELALPYHELNRRHYTRVPFEEGTGSIAAEAVIPYPPGIPLILKGEEIKAAHIAAIEQLRSRGVRIQQRESGILVYSN